MITTPNPGLNTSIFEKRLLSFYIHFSINEFKIRFEFKCR